MTWTYGVVYVRLIEEGFSFMWEEGITCLPI